MKQTTPHRMPKEWMHESHAAPEGGRLDVYCPVSNPEWIPIGLEWWRRHLHGLEQVRDHHWGGRVECGMAGADGTLCYFKRFTARNPRYLYKVQRARHAVVHEHHIRRFGFNVPDTVCLLERRRFGIVVESGMLSLAVRDSHKVSQIFNAGAGGLIQSTADKRHLLRRVAEEVGRWHNAGLFHGDLHLGNLFCQRQGDQFRFYWLDNEEGRIYRRLPVSRRVHDLNHIVRQRHRLTVTDRMRLWKSYVRVTDLSGAEQEKVLRAVARKSRAFWKKKGWL